MNTLLSQSSFRALAAASLLGMLSLTACEQKVVEKKTIVPRVFAMKVADASGLSERSFPGRASAGQEVNLSFRVSGPLIALPIDVGTEVGEGDVIARIDPKDFESAVRTVQAQLEREQARARRANADLQRLENIMREDPGATSQTAVDRARQVRDSARASTRSIAASVTAARDQLSYTELKAPFSGVVVATYVENFETVVAKQPVARLVNPASIEFVIAVPESLIGLAPTVESIEVVFDAQPDVKVPAAIKEIGKEASQATRTYPVTLVMEQPDGLEILPGMAGQARVQGKAPKAAGVEVPATALFTRNDASYVWIIDEAGKTLSQRSVQIGAPTRFGVTVDSGLKAGEWIVIKGVHSVSDGQQVRIIDVAKESDA